LPDIRSQAYSDNPALLDSAFTVPAFAAGISAFNEEFFAEILGMTLQLEWSVLQLRQTVALLNLFNVDPLYYVLHIGIDNASEGHGHLAKQAVEIYLDNAFEQGGEELVQKLWKRIFTGYIAFGLLGSLGDDLTALIQANNAKPRDKMLALIASKTDFGRLNHMDKKLGDFFINDLFQQPELFLQQIEKHLVDKLNPGNSQIFNLTSFNGPMYHVFTPAELEVWREYIESLTKPPEKEKVEEKAEHPLLTSVPVISAMPKIRGEHPTTFSISTAPVVTGRYTTANRPSTRAAKDPNRTYNGRVWLTSPARLKTASVSGRIYGMGAIH